MLDSILQLGYIVENQCCQVGAVGQVREVSVKVAVGQVQESQVGESAKQRREELDAEVEVAWVQDKLSQFRCVDQRLMRRNLRRQQVDALRYAQ